MVFGFNCLQVCFLGTSGYRVGSFPVEVLQPILTELGLPLVVCTTHFHQAGPPSGGFPTHFEGPG